MGKYSDLFDVDTSAVNKNEPKTSKYLDLFDINLDRIDYPEEQPKRKKNLLSDLERRRIESSNLTPTEKVFKAAFPRRWEAEKNDAGYLSRLAKTGLDVASLPFRAGTAGIESLPIGKKQISDATGKEIPKETFLESLGRKAGSEDFGAGRNLVEEIARAPENVTMMFGGPAAIKGIDLLLKAAKAGKYGAKAARIAFSVAPKIQKAGSVGKTAVEGLGMGAAADVTQKIERSTNEEGLGSAGEEALATLINLAGGAGGNVGVHYVGKGIKAAGKAVGEALKGRAARNVNIEIRPGQRGGKEGYAGLNAIKYNLIGKPQEIYDKGQLKLIELNKSAKDIGAESTENINLVSLLDRVENSLTRKENVHEYDKMIGLINDLRQKYEAAYPNADVSIADAMGLRTQIGENAAFEARKGIFGVDPNANWQEKVYNKLYGEIKDEIQSKAGPKLKEINKQQSEIIPIVNAAKRRVNISESSLAAGLADFKAGSLGTGIGSSIGLAGSGDKNWQKNTGIGGLLGMLALVAARRGVGSKAATKLMYRLGERLSPTAKEAITVKDKSLYPTGKPWREPAIAKEIEPVFDPETGEAIYPITKKELQEQLAREMAMIKKDDPTYMTDAEYGELQRSIEDIPDANWERAQKEAPIFDPETGESVPAMTPKEFNDYRKQLAIERAQLKSAKDEPDLMTDEEWARTQEELSRVPDENAYKNMSEEERQAFDIENMGEKERVELDKSFKEDALRNSEAENKRILFGRKIYNDLYPQLNENDKKIVQGMLSGGKLGATRRLSPEGQNTLDNYFERLKERMADASPADLDEIGLTIDELPQNSDDLIAIMSDVVPSESTTARGELAKLRAVRNKRGEKGEASLGERLNRPISGRAGEALDDLKGLALSPLGTMSRATVGAGVGGMVGDTKEERLKNAAIGAAAAISPEWVVNAGKLAAKKGVDLVKDAAKMSRTVENMPKWQIDALGKQLAKKYGVRYRGVQEKIAPDKKSTIPGFMTFDLPGSGTTIIAKSEKNLVDRIKESAKAYRMAGKGERGGFGINRSKEYNDYLLRDPGVTKRVIKKWVITSPDGKVLRADHDTIEPDIINMTDSNGGGRSISVAGFFDGLEKMKKAGYNVKESETVGTVSKRVMNEVLKNKNLQAGEINAWHGSPHKIEGETFGTKPLSETIGTGEGNKSFGHGLYFTNQKDIAKYYAENVKDEQTIGSLNNHISAISKQLDKLRENQFTLPKDVYNAKTSELKNKYDEIMGKRDALVKSRGNTYQVTIHKGKTPDQYDYLQWDKNITEDQVDRILDKLSSYSGEDIEEVRNFLEPYQGKNKLIGSGEEIYKEISNILGSDKKASEYLLLGGIDGIEYPAGSLSMFGNSGFEKSARNYVVFDPNAVTIEKVNDVPLNKSQSGAVSIGKEGKWKLPKPSKETGKIEPAATAGVESKDDVADAAEKWATMGTESPYFKRWFAGSKVVDKKGKPLVVYHGGRTDINNFEEGPVRGRNLGAGFFTNDPKVSNQYAIFGEPTLELEVENAILNKDIQITPFGDVIKGRSTPVFLNIKKPIYDNDLITEILDSNDAWLGKLPEKYQDLYDNNFYNKEEINEMVNNDDIHLEFNDFLPTDEGFKGNNLLLLLSRILNKNGEYAKEIKLKYDGIIFNDKEVGGTTYIPFFPTQIKSATGNRGTFDPKNPNINYAVAGGAGLGGAVAADKSKRNQKQSYEANKKQ